jgi:hypothetical protein
MILFLDEERAYLYWVAHHRSGFVLDCLRKPAKSRLVLHRATCPEIKISPSKRTHWTTGRRMKGCSLDREALVAWAVEQAQAEPSLCPECLAANGAPAEVHPGRLSHLESDVLAFVLEVASLHLDDRDGSYRLTVSKTAQCLSKTPGQLNAALSRLAEAGLLRIAGKIKSGDYSAAAGRLLPTVAAMRTLPAYQDASDAEIEAELALLTEES